MGINMTKLLKKRNPNTSPTYEDPHLMRHYIIRILMLAIPIALQNLINVGVSVTDTLMIGSISEEQMSGISYANQPYFIFTTVLFGLASGSIVLTAQYWGKREL